MTEFNNDAIAVLNRITAKNIEQKMRILRMSPTEISKRRWIWELLQNAKDKAAIDFPEQQVSILVNLVDNLIEFSHNYGYFTKNNIEGLIRQISSEDKDRDDVDQTEIPKATGRFGTGFMTTHLLSEKVRVQGIYQRNEDQFQRIQFPLDRSGRVLPELIESINDSFNSAENSLRNSPLLPDVDFSQFNTVFHYELDAKGKAIAEIGIEDLEISLPYALIFINRIKRVQIIKENQAVIVYEKQSITALTDNIKLIELEKSYEQTTEKLLFVCLSQDLTSIAIEVEKVNDQIFFKPFDSRTPRLFLDFPLVGTVDFHFPVIINNPFLEPTEPRDGVFLTEELEEHIVNNKQVVQAAVALYFTLLDYAITHNWQNLYLLAKTNLPAAKDWLSINWYKGEIQQVLRAKLLKSSIVDTDNPQQPRIKLEDALFPYHPVQAKIGMIWEFAMVLRGDRLPKRSQIDFWYKIIDQTWAKDLRYDLKGIVTDVAACQNVNSLANYIRKTNEETLAWLNQLIEFVVVENESLLNHLAIIPNQYGSFRLQKLLAEDKNIPAELKDVLKILQEDWREILKHQSISAGNLPTSKNIRDIVARINQIIKEKQNKFIGNAVLDLVSCIPNDASLPKIRHLIWEIAQDFYKNIPAQKALASWIPEIWEESDRWFIDILLQNIYQKQKISNLANHLNKDAFAWLQQIISHITINEFEYHLNVHAILPDQNGDFHKKQELFVDGGIDEELKDILEDLGDSCRSELLAIEIKLELPGKIQKSKDIASRISVIVENIFKQEGLGTRSEKNKRIFAKLFTWFYENDNQAEVIFETLYDKRHRLKTDEEIINDMKFKQNVLNNANGYSEAEILNLVNTPKEKILILDHPDLKEMIASSLELSNIIKELLAEKAASETSEPQPVIVNPQDLLISHGIYSREYFEIFRHTKVGRRVLRYIDIETVDFSQTFAKINQMIERAKRNVKAYLSNQENYNCDRWHEESITVITGVEKKGRPIKIVVRPSDGGQVVIFDPNEVTALESPDAELWTDNSTVQEILTLGKVLIKTGINRILL